MIDLEETIYPLSTDPKDTQEGWKIIINLCKQKEHFGFGVLDSFLDGPDLDNRIELVVNEAKNNDWLKGELKDTLSLDQSKNLTTDQIDKLQRAFK